MPTYYSMKDWTLIGFEISKKKGKMYNAILINNKNDKIKEMAFGSKNYENFSDLTGLDAYPHLIHGDEKRKKSYRARHKGFLKKGFYSPSFFSYAFLWS